MTAPSVVIEVAAPDTASPLAATLAQACTDAAVDGPCALSGSDPGGATPHAVAIVTWSGDRRSVRIELGRRLPEGARWITRELSFRAEDAEVERWRAAGLVIATLASGVASEEPAASAPAPPRPSPAPPPERPRPLTPDPPTPTRVWIDALALAGPALDDGSWRAGPALRGAVAFGALPLLALASVRYLVRPADDRGVAAQWASGSVGVGGHVALGGGALELEARVEIVAERLSANAEDPATNAEDSGGRWLAGARAGVGVAWMAHPSLGVTVGLDATGVHSGTQIRLHDVRLLRAAPWSISPSIGLRLELPWTRPR